MRGICTFDFGEEKLLDVAVDLLTTGKQSTGDTLVKASALRFQVLAHKI
jgi:hypothetical protein